MQMDNSLEGVDLKTTNRVWQMNWLSKMIALDW